MDKMWLHLYCIVLEAGRKSYHQSLVWIDYVGDISTQLVYNSPFIIIGSWYEK